MLFCEVSVADLSNQQQHLTADVKPGVFKRFQQNFVRKLCFVCVFALRAQIGLHQPLEIKQEKIERCDIWNILRFKAGSLLFLFVRHSLLALNVIVVHAFVPVLLKQLKKALTHLKKGHLFKLKPENTETDW